MKACALIFLAMCGAPHAAPVSVAVITLEPQVFAIQNGPDGGVDTTYTVYYGDGALVYSPEGVPLRDLSFDEVYAQARQAGLVR